MENSFYVRGQEARQKLVEEHQIIPVFRRLLGTNEEVKCVCKNPVKKEIYFFELIDKSSGERINIFTGSDCGQKILALDKKEKPPLFSLFKSKKNNIDSTDEPKGANRGDNNVINFCPLNQELYNAIGVLCESWGIKFPNGQMLNLLLYLIKSPNRPTDNWAIEKFNGFLSKDKKERSLAQMVHDLQKEGLATKSFSFPLMHEIMEQSTVKNLIQ